MTQTSFELRRKLLQLEALYDIGRALNRLRPEEELLEELMHRAVGTLDATLAFVFSLTEEGHLAEAATLLRLRERDFSEAVHVDGPDSAELI